MTRQNVTVSSGLSDDAIDKLPNGGIAEFLLEQAIQKSLYTWLAASTNKLFLNPATPIIFKQSPTGYKLAFKMKTSDTEMVLGLDMRLQTTKLKAPQSDRFETSFAAGQQGFL